MGILIFILLLSFLVLIHELGHFFAAKWAKIDVEEFGIGYPPKLFKLFRWQNVDFTFNWIPFGGFVRMTGEDDNPETKANNPKKGEFYYASIFQRLVVILAGATVNFLFGIVAFAFVYSNVGIPTDTNLPIVGYVSPDSPAAEVGLPTNVQLVSLEVDGTTFVINTVDDAIETIGNHKGKTVNLTVSAPCSEGSCVVEGGQTIEVYLRNDDEIPENDGSLGVLFDSYIFKKYSWWQMPGRSIVYGMKEALFLGQQILLALGQIGEGLGRGQIPKDLAGPVGIVHQAQQAGILSQGFLMILSFGGMLSINLAIMNVLPIPPLDGGKAVFTILEGFLKRSQLQKIEYYSSYGGYIFLLGLIIIVTIRDVIRIF